MQDLSWNGENRPTALEGMKKDQILGVVFMVILWGGMGVFALWLVFQDLILGKWIGWLLIALFAAMGIYSLRENTLTKVLGGVVDRVVILLIGAPMVALALGLLAGPLIFHDLSIQIPDELVRGLWYLGDVVAAVFFFKLVPPREIWGFFKWLFGKEPS